MSNAACNRIMNCLAQLTVVVEYDMECSTDTFPRIIVHKLIYGSIVRLVHSYG